MDQNRMPGKTCSVCNQRFNTDRELQEHQKTAHSQEKNRQPASNREFDNPDQGDQKHQRIA